MVSECERKIRLEKKWIKRMNRKSPDEFYYFWSIRLILLNDFVRGAFFWVVMCAFKCARKPTIFLRWNQSLILNMRKRCHSTKNSCKLCKVNSQRNPRFGVIWIHDSCVWLFRSCVFPSLPRHFFFAWFDCAVIARCSSLFMQISGIFFFKSNVIKKQWKKGQ